MERFLSLTVSGAVTGAIFSLVAAGLVLSYTATGIFNFSYGAVAFASAFIFYQLNTSLHVPIVPAAALVILVFAPLLGLLLDVAVFRPLARATESAKIMATVGLLIAIPALVTWLNDQLVDIVRLRDREELRRHPGLAPAGSRADAEESTGSCRSTSRSTRTSSRCSSPPRSSRWRSGVLLRHTPLGLQMRAVVDRADLASTRGINERTTSRYAWVIGMMLAALAGVVGAPVIGSLGPAAVHRDHVRRRGGRGARRVALGAVGVRRRPAARRAREPGRGLRHRHQRARRTSPASTPRCRSSSCWSGSSSWRATRAVGAARRPTRSRRPTTSPTSRSGGARCRGRARSSSSSATSCSSANDYWVGVIATGLTLSLIFLSFVVVTGMGGMVSLAQATFVLMAGLTTGMLIGRYEWSFFPAMLVGRGGDGRC